MKNRTKNHPSFSSSPSLYPIERLGCPVVMFDRHFRLKRANRLFYNIFNTGLDDVLEIISSEPPLDPLLDAEGGVSNDIDLYEHNSFEIQIKEKNGQLVDFVVAVTYFEDSDPSSTEINILAVLHDITSRKQLERELVRRDKAILTENIELKKQVDTTNIGEDIIGKSPPMKALMEKVRNASKSDIAVLIEGESGTGKELVARQIHKTSHRKGMPFIAVNCSTIPEPLMESLFFGHKKGAFTGAYENRTGYFQEAEGGTLFLDEINSLSLNLQAKFLRVLEDRSVKPVGSNMTVKVNFRLICASNEILTEAVADKTFRDDLYYRIGILTLEVPPLRDRMEDLPLLVQYIGKRYQKKYQKPGTENPYLDVPEQILNKLLHYSFPGNVRELNNILFRYFTLGLLEIHNWTERPLDEVTAKKSVASGQSEDDQLLATAFDKNLPLKDITRQMEKAYITQLLIQERYNRSKVSQILRVSRKTLYLKIKEYGIE